MALNIAKEIAALKCMTVGQLREKYRTVFGEPTQAGNKDFLFKRIVWRIQSLAEGDLFGAGTQACGRNCPRCGYPYDDPQAAEDQRRRGTSHGRRACRSGRRPAADPRNRSDANVSRPGAPCDCSAKGFDYDGEVYRTLSAVAKKITGARWNGFLFFGLVKPGAEATDG